MKYLGIFCLCFLLSGVRSNIIDDLKNAGENALQTTLNYISTDGIKTVLSGLATAALGSLFGKRNVDSTLLQAFSLVKHEAGNLEQVFHNYGGELQQIYNQIKNLDFLEHNPEEFLTNINKVVDTHNIAINGIMQHLASALTHLEHSQKRGLTDTFLSGLQSAVTHLQTTFQQVAGGLNTEGTGLLGTLTQHLGGVATNLQSQLEGLKGTAGQLLAQGQEALANLGLHATDTLTQTHTGLLGAAHQAIDTLLHPQTK